MSGMNARQRFLRIMNYEPVDRLPLIAFEPYEQMVLQRWRTEGLRTDQTPQELLDMDRIIFVPLSFSARPRIDHRIISEDDEYLVETDNMGTVIRRRKNAPTLYYGCIDHPMKNMSDWREYKKYFLPVVADRMQDGWKVEQLQELNKNENPVGILLYPFFFRLGFYAMGMEDFMLAFHDQPDLIHEMFGYWSWFTCELIKPILAEAKVDFFVFGEDLAYKSNTHVSPGIYAEFWRPYQDPILQLALDNEVPLVSMWSAGNINSLLPDFMEHGFNCTWPIEHSAMDMDAVKLRKRYGRNLRLAGNIAVKALIDGPLAIDREIERLMPLIRESGFIPALDDMVPAEAPLSHYRHMINKLRDIEL